MSNELGSMGSPAYVSVTINTHRLECLVVVHAIRSSITMSSPFDHMVMDCRRMLKELITTSVILC